MTRFLRLFREFRVLEEEYERTRAANRSVSRTVKSLRLENVRLGDALAASREEGARLSADLSAARERNVEDTRKVADFNAFLRFGRTIYNAPDEVPVPSSEHKPIPKNRPQAIDLVKVATQRYNDQIRAIRDAAGAAPPEHVPSATEATAEFFENELKTG